MRRGSYRLAVHHKVWVNAGRHFALIEARDARDLAALDAALGEAPASAVARAAGFATQADKRATHAGSGCCRSEGGIPHFPWPIAAVRSQRTHPTSTS